jgi:membrane protease YdiL (CAAX protease family)
MAVLLAIGAYALSGPTAAPPWLPLAESLEGAVEELIFRGAIFRLLSTVFGMWWALGLSSGLFGALHVSRPRGPNGGARDRDGRRYSPRSALRVDAPAVGLNWLSYCLEFH